MKKRIEGPRRWKQNYGGAKGGCGGERIREQRPRVGVGKEGTWQGFDLLLAYHPEKKGKPRKGGQTRMTWN